MILFFVILSVLFVPVPFLATGSTPPPGPVDRDAIFADLVAEAYEAVAARARVRPAFLAPSEWSRFVESRQAGGIA